MKKFITMLLTLVLAVSSLGLFTACGGNEKVAALICLHGEVSSYDKNFIDAFKAACEAKGLKQDQYTIVTDIPEEGDDCYNRAAQFADAGYKAVFADSFGHEANMIKAAREFPNVQFCHATGTGASKSLDTDATNDTPANFHNAFASIYEGRYLAGVAAGLKLKALYGDDITNDEAKIGYVGAHPYAEVISGYTSFYLGVKSIVPNVTMEVRYTYSWYDEVREKAAAEALINNGAKLVSGHADSMGVPTACKENDIPNVFYNGVSTESTFVIASKINWQPYFEKMIDAALNGTTLEKDYCGTLATGSVQITALGAAAAPGTQAVLDTVKTGLMNGTIKVFNTANFTVYNAKENDTYNKITMDTDGKLTSYLADIIDLGDFAGETNAIENGIFTESSMRSAPYFDIIIDGITIGADLSWDN
ncbi:MAG: BMP family ABC transporter substrate-binding protein [Clostridia bacterium]|nr:BMP family ABC transporter substrate-binding protein [Clostridia bacterium]